MSPKKKITLWMRLRELRKKHNLTQVQFSEASKIPKITIRKLEAWIIQNPTISTLSKYLWALNESVDDIVKEFFSNKED